ncbi:MAG: Vitamin B12-dependent ribonucleotide reductase, partial [Bdellovibrionaceae bacterium]|nr:Vitamin B12-dependent ribonucleotide reductase [Pseudobdellovibrionaceae bacterium]
GFTNLGSLLMRLGLAYDSEIARTWAAALSALMSGMAWYTSTEMSEIAGPFPAWRKNRRSVERVLSQHAEYVWKVNWADLSPDFASLAEELWTDVLRRNRKFGVRNAQTTAIAPTGTIGLLMDCDTMGIEPDYALVKVKKLVGGQSRQIVNEAIVPSLKRLGYSDSDIQRIQSSILKNGDVAVDTPIRPEHLPIFATATGQNPISPEAHLKMMAAVQPFISGAISKTVNLPASATVDDVSRIYWQAWELGLKSISIYRNGSKATQPLGASPPVSQ